MGENETSSWFKTTARYEGHGYADLIAPQTRVEGAARISFNESGESTFIMKLENMIIGKKSTEPEIVELLIKSPLTTNEYAKLSQYLRQIEGNKCAKLVVNTRDGVFSAEGIENIYYYVNGTYIIFHFLHSQFISSKDLTPKYWIMPLINFISEFSQGSSNIEHPLKINNVDGRIIKFEFNEKIGFIEPLPNYAQCKMNLQSGLIKNKITSIMVGEIGENSIELEDLGKWFPFDFLGILSLATGSEVSASCIEFRGQDGDLISRIHPRLKVSCYSRGHVAIDEVHNIGIGSLLTSFQFFPDRCDSLRESYFTAVVNNLVKGGLDCHTLEDKLSYIFRGIDCLCERYELKAIDLRDDLNPEQTKEIEAAIRDAIKLAENRLSILEKDSLKKGNETQCKAIRAISRKMNQIKPYLDTTYGKSVVKLMHKFCLKDVEIVETHYKSHPRRDKRKWVQVLPYYRGKTMHSGYFKFYENEYYRSDVPRICRHLHDILLRIVLKMLDYKGTYQPTLKNFKSVDSLDWIKHNEYAFSWDDIPETNNEELMKFLAQTFFIHRAENAKVEKIDDGKTIRICTNFESISLALNDENTEVVLKFNDVHKCKLVAKIENSKLNIYYTTSASDLGY